MNDQPHQSEDSADSEAAAPLWLRASVGDLDSLDFEGPIAQSTSGNSNELSSLFREAVGDAVDTPAAKVFSMLAAVTGMSFRSSERNEPFGAMLILADGHRSPIPSDFRGAPIKALAAMAERAKHPALRARLGDLCWVLDRKRGDLGREAISAYIDIVKKVDDGSLAFRYEHTLGALQHSSRDLLRRALQIGRSTGWDKAEAISARTLLGELRKRAILKALTIPGRWLSELDLDFGISDPLEVGRDVETLIGALAEEADPHSKVDLWRLAARAYHYAKSSDDAHRARSAASDQFVLMSERQPLAMMASSMLSSAIAELHGVPDKRERRKELRHRLVDVQSDITEEMSSFSQEIDLEDVAQQVEVTMRQQRCLRDKLFAFAALDRSPDPEELVSQATDSIVKHPLSSLFGASHHDREGKVIHRTRGSGFGAAIDDSAIQSHIAQHEDFRRQITVAGSIEVARRAMVRDHFLSDDVIEYVISHSPFVPPDLVGTFSRGFSRYFQGDFISALYILTPLVENSLRHLLKAHNHDVTIFDDATQTQQDRTISSLFEQMRDELEGIFGAALIADIERVFLNKPGPYLRHALAHGLLHDADPYSHNAIYGCWLIFRLCLLPLFPHREQLRLPVDEAASDDRS